MSWEDIVKQTDDGKFNVVHHHSYPNVLNEIAHDEQDFKYLMSLNPQKLKQVLEARKLVSQGIPSDAPTTERIPQWKKKLQKVDMDEARRLGNKYAPEDMKEPLEEIDREQVIAEVQGWINKYDWSGWNRDNKLLPPRIMFRNRGYVFKDGKDIFYTTQRKIEGVSLGKLRLGELTGTSDLEIDPHLKHSVGTKELALRMLHSNLKEGNHI